MKFFLMLALLFASIGPAVGLVSPAVQKAHAASFEIGQATITDNSGCSATAVGPQALLTATHCEQPTDFVFINDKPAHIIGRLRDGNDHTIYIVDVHFEIFVTVELDATEISQDVFTFGNPGDWRDIYQCGYTAGILPGKDYGDKVVGPSILLFSLQAFPGESGAGIFNTDGKLIAVLGFANGQGHNGEVPINFAGAYPLHFTQAQLDKVRAFALPVVTEKK